MRLLYHFYCTLTKISESPLLEVQALADVGLVHHFIGETVIGSLALPEHVLLFDRLVLFLSVARISLNLEILG